MLRAMNRNGFVQPAGSLGDDRLDDIYQLSAFSRLVSQSVAGFTTSYLLYRSNSGVQIFDNKIWLGRLFC
jgi:hypothetical protein